MSDITIEDISELKEKQTEILNKFTEESEEFWSEVFTKLKNAIDAGETILLKTGNEYEKIHTIHFQAGGIHLVFPGPEYSKTWIEYEDMTEEKFKQFRTPKTLLAMLRRRN